MPSDKMNTSVIQYLPLFLFLLFPFTFLTTYLAAVTQGQVDPNFSYISDAASYAPEGCIFSQFVNIGAVLLIIMVYIRYCAICQYCELYSISPNLMVLNKLGLWMGLCSAFGLTLVANFQSLMVQNVHFFGAGLNFGAGTLYFWIQALCSYQMPALVHIFLAHFRVVLSMISTVCSLLFVTGVKLQLELFGNDIPNWYPGDEGWMLHILSTGSEWIAALCFCLSILTFYSEFSLISVAHPKITLRYHPISECDENLLNS